MRRLGRRTSWVALALLLASCAPAQHQPLRSPISPSPGPTTASHRPKVPADFVPDPALTPGATFAVGVARICRPGYASEVRDVSDADKTAVYARYGIPWVPYQHEVDHLISHEVDHLISLELGGSNAIRNLWPEPYAGRWGARTKDVLENRLHTLVCAGELPLRAAQRQEATDWVGAYLRFVGPPSKPGDGGGSTSAGGYYASSYPTASTIYCADDTAWHTLSPAYRVHFTTLEDALVRFPSYHLHQPC